MPILLLDIIGNGQGPAPAPEFVRPTVIFNSPRNEVAGSNEIIVRNPLVAGFPRRSSFSVESGFLQRVEVEIIAMMLEAASIELHDAIGCTPSAGLTFLCCATRLAENVNVYRMGLNPGLSRPVGLPPRSPLPSTFHNWLGERRMALKLIRSKSGDRIHWPSLRLDRSDLGTATAMLVMSRLQAVFEAADKLPRSVVLQELSLLARVSLEDWQRDFDPEACIAMERFFFLDRHRKETANWWLYDDGASRLVDTLHRKLLWCQQEHALHHWART